MFGIHRGPVPVGTRVLSVQGEEDYADPNDDMQGVDPDGKRRTGPFALGVINEIEGYTDAGGWAYRVAFKNGVVVTLDAIDGLSNPKKYLFNPRPI